MDEEKRHSGEKDRSLADESQVAPAQDKVDPISAGPTAGNTIAGRQINTGGTGDLSNASGGDAVRVDNPSQPGGPNTGGKGVTGADGNPDSAAHSGPNRAQNNTETEG